MFPLVAKETAFLNNTMTSNKTSIRDEQDRQENHTAIKVDFELFQQQQHLVEKAKQITHVY